MSSNTLNIPTNSSAQVAQTSTKKIVIPIARRAFPSWFSEDRIDAFPRSNSQLLLQMGEFSNSLMQSPQNPFLAISSLSSPFCLTTEKLPMKRAMDSLWKGPSRKRRKVDPKTLKPRQVPYPMPSPPGGFGASASPNFRVLSSGGLSIDPDPSHDFPVYIKHNSYFNVCLQTDCLNFESVKIDFLKYKYKKTGNGQTIQFTPVPSKTTEGPVFERRDFVDMKTSNVKMIEGVSSYRVHYLIRIRCTTNDGNTFFAKFEDNDYFFIFTKKRKPGMSVKKNTQWPLIAAGQLAAKALPSRV